MRDIWYAIRRNSDEMFWAGGNNWVADDRDARQYRSGGEAFAALMLDGKAEASDGGNWIEALAVPCRRRTLKVVA
jgi:hypothetical protein